MLERIFHRLHIIEFHNARGLIQRNWCTKIAFTLHGVTGSIQGCKSFIDRAVITLIDNDDLALAGNQPAITNRMSVGIGRGHRELPQRQSKTSRQLLSNDDCILGRQHRGKAMFHLFGDCSDRWRWRVTRHRSGIAQTQVNVIMAIDIGEVRTLGGFHEDRIFAGPFRHP